MNRLAHPPRRTSAPRRQVGVLTAVIAVLLAAFFLLPNALTHDGVHAGNVGGAFRRGMVAYWDSGRQGFPRELDGAVGFWFRFHLVKAGVSALLLAAVVLLGVVLWRWSRQRAGRPGRLRTVPPGVLVALLGPFALVGLVANAQGAAAPFASLLPMLTDAGGGEAAATVSEIRRQIADHPTGRPSPALAFMIRDFALYHAVLAAMAAVLALTLAGACAALWRRRRITRDTPSRRALALGAAASAVLAVLALVIALANTTSAAHSPEALAALFEGGW